VPKQTIDHNLTRTRSSHSTQFQILLRHVWPEPLEKDPKHRALVYIGNSKSSFFQFMNFQGFSRTDTHVDGKPRPSWV